MACATVLVEMCLAAPAPAPETTDPWKLYEGLSTDIAATQALVQSLNMATGFLLLCPFAAGAIGLVFGLLGQNEKIERAAGKARSVKKGTAPAVPFHFGNRSRST